MNAPKQRRKKSISRRGKKTSFEVARTTAMHANQQRAIQPKRFSLCQTSSENKASFLQAKCQEPVLSRTSLLHNRQLLLLPAKRGKTHRPNHQSGVAYRGHTCTDRRPDSDLAHIGNRFFFFSSCFKKRNKKDSWREN